ncbi:MAG: hypothetical protein ACK4YP_09180, partial [Myxococcota bacterium]
MIALALLGLAVAEAAERPPMLPAGTVVAVTKVSRRDAFWRFRDELVGQECVVGEPGLARHRGRWYGGELACADGQPYYFFQVDVEVRSFAPPALVGAGPELDADALFAPPSPAAAPPPVVPEAKVGGVVVAGAAPARATPAPVVETASEWAVGAPVRIRGVSPADASSTRTPSVVGLPCLVQEPLTRTGDGWVAGTLRCAGADTFFYQVALDAMPVAGAASGATPAT